MIKKLINFIKDCRHELVEKTTWPTKDAVLNSTIVVIISIITVSAALFGVDYISNQLVHTIVVQRVNLFKDALDWIFLPTLGVPLRFVAGLFGLFLILTVLSWLKKRLIQ